MMDGRTPYRLRLSRLLLVLLVWIVCVLSATAALVRWLSPILDRTNTPIRTHPPNPANRSTPSTR